MIDNILINFYFKRIKSIKHSFKTNIIRNKNYNCALEKSMITPIFDKMLEAMLHSSNNSIILDDAFNQKVVNYLNTPNIFECSEKYSDVDNAAIYVAMFISLIRDSKICIFTKNMKCWRSFVYKFHQSLLSV